MLNGRYPDSNIEAAAAAFALIMSKLRISDDMNGDFWPYWIHFILDKQTLITVTLDTVQASKQNGQFFAKS